MGGRARLIVLGIETSTTQTALALGSEHGTTAAIVLAGDLPNHEVIMPGVEQLLRWSGVGRSSITGIAVDLGPGLFTGMRVGIATAKTLAQMLSVPIVGLASLDVLAHSVRHARRLICAAIDAKRKELFYAFYRPVPGGVARQTEFEVGAPARLTAELEATSEDILLVGNGAVAYGRQLEEAGKHVELAPASYGYPAATALVELAIPRLQREDSDRLYDLRPYYVRKSDAEILWDQRRGAG